MQNEIDLLIPFAFGIIFGAGGLGVLAWSRYKYSLYVENTGDQITFGRWVFYRLFRRKKLKG